ncbi:hypothetical protein KP509_04G046500 [Ceratopteris richardii]|uniref:Ribosomal protein/NADH dehydrogenase domain-containing protein n=1 Tax=Ceratopteris richardii TaxID=49495 RepID=A0A8T2UV31_CERRI|nr:hypothetical protein KP509_04G046500 [Ceratopteris richardii]KAH7439132.1 hypothetical protein KP509_04G046500 [Ceratopteris richardii]
MSWATKLKPAVRELRFHFCQTSPSSAPTRQFIQGIYKDLKTANPQLPILIRECSGIQPRMWARYEFGEEKSVPLDGLTEKQISSKLKELVGL